MTFQVEAESVGGCLCLGKVNGKNSVLQGGDDFRGVDVGWQIERPKDSVGAPLGPNGLPLFRRLTLATNDKPVRFHTDVDVRAAEAGDFRPDDIFAV